MSSAGPVDVHVDLAELGRVHTELQNVISHLEGLDGQRAGGADPSELGDADVAHAVDTFVGRWAHEREQLLGHLHDCATFVQQAIQDYTRTEQILAGAITATGAAAISAGAGSSP